jgi:hypothetical protein
VGQTLRDITLSVDLKRPSRQVQGAEASYAESLGNAALVSDDDLFNAAVVSFRSFGLMHGLLIEVEPIYMLKLYVRSTTTKLSFP